MPKKTASWIILLIFITCIATLALSISPARAQPTTIYVDDSNASGPWNGTTDFPYENITSALNQAAQGDTIQVRSGTYYEHIEINKTITLLGQNQTDTIIDGSGQGYIPIILVTASNTVIANFTIKNTAIDIDTYGILISKTQNVTMTKNTIKETYRGIVISNSSECKIFNNSFSNNYAYGVTLRSESNLNLFKDNNIAENNIGASLDVSCQNNTFYHNSFINNNVYQVDNVNYGTRTKWNSTYPTGGNYWSDYTGIDLKSGPNQNLNGSDGIGDTPYVAGGARDYYPLMYPYVPALPIAKFTYSPEKPVKNEVITFNASASYDLNGSIVGYEWNFGDGNITTIASPIIRHFYTSYGNYTVSLTVTDNDGLTSIATKQITVQKRTSTLSIKVYPATIEITKSTIINGTLAIQDQPPHNTVNVLLKHRIQGETNWTTLTTAITNAEGLYTYNWTPSSIATYEIEASWDGNETVFPANSSTATLNVNKMSSKLTISPKPSRVTIGQNITISGKLSPTKEGENITISLRTLPNTWTTITVTRTDHTGNYLYNWTTTQTGVNWLKASWPGDELTTASEDITSITIDQISSNITVTADKTNVIVGTNITINGRITPSRANVNVTISIRMTNGTGSWDAVAKTNVNGTYTYVWTPYANGVYKIKASWQGDQITMPAQSDEIEIEAQSKVETPLVQYVIAAIAVLAIFIVLGIIIRKTKRK